MSSNDPTDQALAVIASIFDKPGERSAEDKPGDAAAGDEGGASQPEGEAAETAQDVSPENAAAQDQAGEEQPQSESEPDTDADRQPETRAEESGEPETDDYVRLGPGPLDALRFKWTMRNDGGNYFVDETIGASSLPVTSGPLSRTEAVALIDQRERDTVKRFEMLRKEIVSGPSERGYQEGDEG